MRRTSEQERLFAKVTDEHGPALQRLCHGHERCPALRQDLLQEVLLGIWRSLERYRGDCSLRTWVYRVAHNVAIRHVDRERRRRHKLTLRTNADEPDRSAAQLPPDAGRTAECELEHAHRIERMRQLIAGLRPLDRQLILLYLEGITQAEIAEITGLSRQNISTRIGRIKQGLMTANHRHPTHGGQHR